MNKTISEALEAAAEAFAVQALYYAEKGHSEKAETNHKLAVQMYLALETMPALSDLAEEDLDQLEAEGYVIDGVLMHKPLTGEPDDMLVVTSVGAVISMVPLLDSDYDDDEENEHTGA